MRAKVLANSNRNGRLNPKCLTAVERELLVRNGYAKNFGADCMELTAAGKAWCGLEGWR